MRTTALLLLVAARAACTHALADRARCVDRQKQCLHGSKAVATDTPLGTVMVTVAGSRKNVTDDDALRAAVLSGVAMATDWLSVDDATAVAIVAGLSTDATAPTTSTPCGTSAPSLTYTIALAPAVLPTASQARQLTDGMAKKIADQFSRVGLNGYHITATDVKLDDTLFAAHPAPYPPEAQAGSHNVLSGYLRASGFGMSVCDVGIAALRNLRRRRQAALQTACKTAKANSTMSVVAKGLVSRHNLANVRYASVVPIDVAENSVFGGPVHDVAQVLDVQIVMAGLTREQALFNVGNITTVTPAALTTHLHPTPGLTGASIQLSNQPWLYNGQDVSVKPMGKVAMVAVIWAPTLMAVALSTSGGIFYVRRRRRARDRAEKIVKLAANGLGKKRPPSEGSGGKPSELLRAIRDAVPTASDPLARLATVQWEIDPADLEVATNDDGEEVVLGEGTSGRVVRGRYAGQDVAIKILTRCDDGGRGLEDLAKEIVMLRACRHPNIVSFVGASIRENGAPPIMVVELMLRGDLYRALDNVKWGSVFTWRRVVDTGGRPRPYTGMNRRIALDVARGLSYLHSRGIVHLDVKSVNILLSKNFEAKLADVGTSRALGDAASATLTSPVGTLCWMAPEVMMGERVSCRRASERAWLPFGNKVAAGHQLTRC